MQASSSNYTGTHSHVKSDKLSSNMQYTQLIHILNKSENATLQLSIVYEKVLDKKYLLKLNNVAQTFSKRFVETPPICLVSFDV